MLWLLHIRLSICAGDNHFEKDVVRATMFCLTCETAIIDNRMSIHNIAEMTVAITAYLG
jgi:hypothetical protein